MAVGGSRGGHEEAPGEDSMHTVEQEAESHAAHAGEELARLSWPAAALAIVALSLGSWAAVVLIVRFLFG